MKGNSRRNLSTAIYVRVSTDEQVQEGFSIRAQTEKLKSYALLKDWDIYDIYSDEGISGKNIVDRPAINRLIDDVENGNVNNVLVFKVDRLTRSTNNLLELVELFEECNCAFNSLTESIDTDTPSGRMFLKIIGIFAEFERENLVSRLKMGFERKVKEGYTLANHRLSYGYTKEKGERIQIIQPDEARIVKEIFSLYVDKNTPLTRIAKTLNERRVPTKTHTGTWDATSIKSLITNPTYIGKVRYSVGDENKYFEADGLHERIISDEDFYLAQNKIAANAATTRTKKPRENSYFCGVLTCGMCKGKYTTHNYLCKTKDNGEKEYKCAYRCNNRYQDYNSTCTNPSVSHEKLERAFSEYIQRISDLTSDDDINVEDTARKLERELLGRIVDLEKQQGNLQERKRQIMERYVNGEIEFDEYKKMLNITNEKADLLDEELQGIKAELPTLTEAPKVLPEDIILNLKENWDSLSNSERMIFLQRFVKNIYITVEKEKTNSNAVRIDGIEFNSGELQRKDTVRSKMRRGNPAYAR